jgi:GT2 family glycosyltransferase
VESDAKTTVAPDISIVAVSWNTLEHLPRALAALPTACAPRTWEAIVVDNASTDGSVEHLAARHDISLVALDTNTGFTRAANTGAARARGRHLLFLNPDVTAPAGSIARLAEVLEQHPEAWAVTPWFRYPDGRPQPFWRRIPGTLGLLTCFTHRGRRIDRLLRLGENRRHQYASLPDPPGLVPIGAVGAACLLVERDEFAALGGFDERFLNFFQDTDLMRRQGSRGRRLLGVGSVEVEHVMGTTFRTLPPVEVHGQFLYAFRQYLQGEPLHRRLAGEAALRLELLGRTRDRRALRRLVLERDSGHRPVRG